MAEPGRTVRVSGLPADIEEDRLRDKLFIHFLRARNGGGEISSVTIVKATPVSALITFEDSGVAQSVLQRRRHTLEVDEKKYQVIVTEHRKRLDPDVVILSLSATVDYSQLPGGIMALTSLHKSHPDLQINYDAPEELCTLNGAYSNVQAALAQLLGHPKGPQSAENKDSGQPATSGSRSVQTAQEPHIRGSEGQSRKPNKQREQRENIHIVGRPFDAYNHSPHRDLSPGGCVLEDTGQTEGAALQLPRHPATSEEDFSLIVDADMFQYLQKHCRKEYQRILSQYGVDVVDMTNQGLTTLFLQVATVGEDGRGQESLKLASKAISRLYEENETKICRGQLSKSSLSFRGEQQRLMDTLSVKFPQLLVNEDDLNIYIIGSSSDVSEAKQFLLLGPSKVRGTKEDVASLLRYPAYDSASSSHAHEQGAPHTLYSTADSQSDRIDQPLRSEEDERRAEGSSRYKLAARFKDFAALGSRPTDWTLRGLSPPDRQTHQGPILGHGGLSESAGILNERVSSALAQNTGGDILFRSRDASPSKASMQHKTSPKAHSTDTRPKSSPISTTQSAAPGSTMLPPAGSGSTLRRARSFSGRPLQKAHVVNQKSQDDSAGSTVRDRGWSSGFSLQTGGDKREVYNAEITVPSVMWKHVKEAYGSRVDDLTSDVQMKESGSAGSRDLTVALRGANSSKVSSCQLALQKLLDSVRVDFSEHELPLSELGVTGADETLQACCAEVHERFKKVTLHVLDERLYIYGPKVLCSQVGATLWEVFSGKPAQIPEQQDLSGSSTSKRSPTPFSQMNEDQSTSLHSYSNPQVMPESQTSKADGTGSSQERRTRQRSETELGNGSIHQPLVRKDPVIKEKVEIAKHSETAEMDGQTESFVGRAETGIDRASHLNDVTSTTAPTDEDMSIHKKERTIHSTHKDSTHRRRAEVPDTPGEPGPGGLGAVCVCGESEMLMKTKCGAAMCSACLGTVHVHCRVCHETEATARGIKGTMSSSKLSITVPGHKNDSAFKITYCIPDGIQGEDQPAPGKPFQGGLFEAFLPYGEKTKKLLPRLQEAFRQGLTFTVTGKDTGARVTWDCIPHKTSLHGGKSGNGYPDSTYLTRLSEVLTTNGIGEPPAKS